MDDVAQETKVQNYTECNNVNAESTCVEDNKLILRDLKHTNIKLFLRSPTQSDLD